jgi:ABC-type enterobactin transport system permease subunit
VTSITHILADQPMPARRRQVLEIGDDVASLIVLPGWVEQGGMTVILVAILFLACFAIAIELIARKPELP